jgi:hypothetical protein
MLSQGSLQAGSAACGVQAGSEFKIGDSGTDAALFNRSLTALRSWSSRVKLRYDTFPLLRAVVHYVQRLLPSLREVESIVRQFSWTVKQLPPEIKLVLLHPWLSYISEPGKLFMT